MRALLVSVACLALLLSACSKSEPVAARIPASKSDEPIKDYPLRGEVVRTETDGKIATIRHEPIGDWMGPMTMDFPVKEDADFEKLVPGQYVSATVHVQGFAYWITGVEQAASPPR